MEIRRYNPASLGAPLGQYSHATRVAAREMLFIAGQLHPGEDVAAQCDGVFGNIALALQDAGAGWSNVVQFTTYLTDADLIPAFMSWRLANFPGMFAPHPYPPNTLLVVSRLVDPKFLIEVQTVAAL